VANNANVAIDDAIVNPHRAESAPPAGVAFMPDRTDAKPAPSPFGIASQRLLEMGYHPIPIMTGEMAALRTRTAQPRKN
jgi:hypothetical protein